MLSLVVFATVLQLHGNIQYAEIVANGLLSVMHTSADD